MLPLRRESRIATLASAGLNTLGVRLPATAIAQDVIKRLGQPVAAPSANPSGQLSPVLASHVMEGLGGRIAAVLNSGPCTVGLESTIVGLAQEPRLLRPGGVTREKLEALLGSSLPMHDPSAAINAPGQLASHYAPSATLRLNATEATDGEMLIGFGDVPGEVSLSQSGDLSEAARNLFDVLHEADRIDRPLAVAPIPDSGLGVAINDRLARAAAPRD